MTITLRYNKLLPSNYMAIKLTYSPTHCIDSKHIKIIKCFISLIFFKENQTYPNTNHFDTTSTILKKNGWDSLSDLVQKVSPLSPNAMLIRVMLPEAAPGRPTLIDGGGEGYDKWGN